MEPSKISDIWSIKVSKGAKIKNRYNQVPHLKPLFTLIFDNMVYRGSVNLSSLYIHITFEDEYCPDYCLGSYTVV